MPANNSVDPSENTTRQLHRSGMTGWSASFLNRLPNTVVKSTSGGAAVTPSITGTMVEPGTTAGDKATLKVQQLDDKLSHIWMTVILQAGQNPTGDDVEIGSVQGSNNGSAGCYYDLTTEEYNVNGTTASAPHVGKYDNTRLDIHIDYEESNTTFRLKNGPQGSVDDTTTINTVVNPNAYLVTATSNGNGDRVDIVYARYCYL